MNYKIALWLVFNLLFTFATQGFSLTYYVATDGSDSNNGSVNAPFQTIKKAQYEVRSNKGSPMTENVIVYLHGGDYFLSESLVFDEKDSGEGSYMITYKRYGNEEPVIIGGEGLTGWASYNASLVMVPAGIARFSTLFEYGESGIAIENPARKDLSLVLPLLDSPGKFYHDQDTGRLYYYPRRRPVENKVVIVPKVMSVMRINGTSMATNGIVRNLVFNGLTFFSSNYITSEPRNTDPETGLIYIENAEKITIANSKILCAGYSGIVVSRYAKNITLEANRVDRCGANGITIAGYAPGNPVFTTASESNVNFEQLIQYNYIARCGINFPDSSGIYVFQSGTNKIQSNTIERIRGNGITISGQQNIIGTRLYGIFVNQSNFFEFVHSRSNRIEYNRILNLDFTSETSAGFYTRDAGKGNVFNNNAVHDINVGAPGAGYAEAAIFADYPSSYLTVSNNIVYANRAADGQFKPVYVRGNSITIDNNVIDDNDPYHDFVIDKGEGRGDLLLLTHNITRTKRGIYFYDFTNLRSATFSGYDNNVFYHPDGAHLVLLPNSDINEAEWRSYYSNDKNSAFNFDPLFREPESRIYEAGPGSPATSRGIRNISQSSIGIQSTFAYRYASDTIEAERYTDASGIANFGTGISAKGNRDYIRFAQVFFEQGLLSCEMRLSCAATSGMPSGRIAEIRIDGSSGTKIGGLELNGTGDSDAYSKINIPINQVLGTHDLYIVFTGSPVQTQLDYFRFRTVPPVIEPEITNTPPFVEILEPAEKASLGARKPALIRVKAFDVDNNFTSVEVSINGVKLYTSTTGEFEYNWSVGEPGEYTILAIARDSEGLTGSASVQVSAIENTNPPPVVHITNPADNAVYTTSPVSGIVVTVTATDGDGIKEVDFFLNNTPLFVDNEEPYDFGLPPVSSGDHVIKVKAIDKTNNAAENSITIRVNSTGNLIGWWKFESGISIAKDSSGHNNDAVITNGQSASGADGSAIYFNGATSVRTNKPLMNDLKQFTIASWIQPEKISYQAGFWGQRGVISFGFISDTSNGLVLSTNECGVLEGDYRFPLNEWHHVAIVGNGQTLRLYFDGNLAYKSESQVPGYGQSDGSFNIGGGGIWNDSGDFFKGAIDEVQLYDTGLSDKQIAAFAFRNNKKPPVVDITEPKDLSTFEGPVDITLKADATDPDGNVTQVEFFANDELLFVDKEKPYEHLWRGVRAGSYTITVKATDNDGENGEDAVFVRLRNKDSDLLGYWPFDEGNGSIARDSSGNENDGDVYSGVWNEGVKGSCLRFSGSGFVQVTKAAGLLNNLSKFTLAGWVRPEDAGYRIGLWGQHGVIEFGFGDPGSINLWTPETQSMDTPYPFPLNEWHHVAAVGDGESLVIYYDGKEAGRINSPAGQYGSSSSIFNIGGKIFDSSGNFISGMIDEVYAYGKALTSAEIEDLANINTDKPEVTITAPKEGDSFDAPADIEITVDAKNKDKSHPVVELYVNTVFFRVDEEEPYSFTLPVYTAGDYELRAKAKNAFGYWTESAITIHVSEGTSGSSTKDSKDDKDTKDASKKTSKDGIGTEFASGKHMHSSPYETYADALKYEKEKQTNRNATSKSGNDKTDKKAATVTAKTKNTLVDSKTIGTASPAIASGGLGKKPRPTESPTNLSSMRFTDVRGGQFSSGFAVQANNSGNLPYIVIVIVLLALAAGAVIWLVIRRQRRSGRQPN